MRKIFVIVFMSLSMGQLCAQELLDFSRKKITAFIISEVSQEFINLSLDDKIRIKTDNYIAIESDMFAWGKLSGNKISLIEKKEFSLMFEITKLMDNQKNEKEFSIIISDKGLEELLSPLGLCLSAAFSGYHVNIYFQGPAVKVLENGFKDKLKGFNSIFSGFARNGLAKIGHSPAQDKIRILEKAGATFFVCQPSMEHFGVKEKDIVFKNIVICEYFTFLEVLDKSDLSFFLQ